MDSVLILILSCVNWLLFLPARREQNEWTRRKKFISTGEDHYCWNGHCTLSSPYNDHRQPHGSYHCVQRPLQRAPDQLKLPSSKPGCSGPHCRFYSWTSLGPSVLGGDRQKLFYCVLFINCSFSWCLVFDSYVFDNWEIHRVGEAPRKRDDFHHPSHKDLHFLDLAYRGSH